MHQLMEKNMYLIYFIYGLSFFISGFIILFQSIKLSDILKNIKYMGLFFLLHGLADWGPLFYPIQSRIYSEVTMKFFESLHVILVILSYYFLATYGVNLLTLYNKKSKDKFIRQIPNLVMVIVISVAVILTKICNFVDWVNHVDIIARFMLGFPSAVLTGFALKNERDIIKDKYEPKVAHLLKVTYITFFIYSIIGGIIVNKSSFFPTNIINSDAFFQFTGFPVQFFRALCGVIIAYCLIQIMEIFHKELVIKLEEKEKEALIWEERERISQDIHDGTMQSLYGIGLRLQYVDALLKNYDDPVVKEHLQFALQKLNQTSKEIRSYITNLRPQIEDTDLNNEVKKIVRDFISETNIQVRYVYDQNKNFVIDEQIINQLTFIIKEALNNIRKHAQATMVQLTILVYEGKIELIIRDNGKGFDCPDGNCVDVNNKGFGLKNMRKRVNDLNGSINICSHYGAGTGINIIIPLEVNNG